MHFKRVLNPCRHNQTHKTSGEKQQTLPAPESENSPQKEGQHNRGVRKGPMKKVRKAKGTTTMARFEISEMNSMGGEARAETFCEMGLMYATGRGCDVDLIAAHKWLNIAAIKGSDRAAALRSDLAMSMSKAELAQALRAAREWMTMH